MLSQLMMLFGFFSLVLVLIYWINRAVRLFDQLIADGQSAAVFLEFTVLSLPSVIRLALPIASFAAAVYVTNRMSTDSELVAVQATGYSPFRMARPVIYFGLIVFLLMSALMHYLVPVSSARLQDRQAEISQNATARLLTEGEFLEPLDGLTFYIREITPAGELRDLFLSDSRSADEQVTYTAAQAFLVRNDGAAQLVMVDGLVQTLRLSDQKLFTTSFDDFAYDIGSFLSVAPREGRRSREVPTLELMQADDALADETRRSIPELMAEGHNRIGQSILGAVSALVGFAALISAGFSRFGVWKQIVVAILLIVFVKAVEAVGLSAARADPNLWFATYLPSVVGFLIGWALLFKAGRPYLFKRRPTAVALS
ncbi:LPS export ABC transporter permease LptF [Yoonia sp. 208BN28-4]